MTSWVLAIDGSFESHWDIAKSEGFWDLTRPSPIEAGDFVYFWISKGSFRGRTLVTSGIRPLENDDLPPWEDSGIRTYTHRFGFDVLSDEPLGSPSWTEVMDVTGFRSAPNFRPHTDDPVAEAELAAFFDAETLDQKYDRVVDALRLTYEDATKDARVLVEKLVFLRQGQPKFRKELLAAYDRTCAVTGTKIEEVLEAAHIAPHKGEHTNVVHNGLLLRADIHTLFDLRLLTITNDLRVQTAPGLAGSQYADLDGRRLTQPTAPENRASPELLAAHRRDCPWFSTATTGA